MKEEKTMQGMGFIVIYIVFFAALIYFTSIRPQKKERQSSFRWMDLGKIFYKDITDFHQSDRSD